MVIQCLECLCDLVLVLTDNCDDIISAHHILKYLHGSAACSDYIAKDIQDILALSIRFRGREMAHSALGADVLKRFAETLPQASMDKPPVLEGRTMSILLIPKPNKD